MGVISYLESENLPLFDSIPLFIYLQIIFLTIDYNRIIRVTHKSALFMERTGNIRDLCEKKKRS